MTNPHTPWPRGHVLALINRLEQRHDVGAMRHNGICVWPLVRMAIGEELVRGDFPRSVATNDRIPWFNKWINLASGIANVATGHVPGRSADLLFFSGPRNLETWNGQIHDRFADPLIAAASQMGLLSTMAEERFGKPSGLPRAEVYPRFDIIPTLWADSVIHARRSKPDPASIPGLIELLQDAGREAQTPELSVIASKLHDLDLYRHYHGKILDRVQPRYVFVVCWYSIDHMGIGQACHDRSIPLVDLQHGVQGPGHLAYGKWLNMPTQGYGLMPTTFWCWDESSAAHIRSWTAGSAIRALALGDPWKEREPGQLAEGAWRDDDRTRVLYSAFLPDALPQMIRDAIRATREQSQWMIRTHPATPEMATELEAIIAAEGLGKVAFVSRSSEMPLAAALQNCQLHVTRYSSVILEAAAKQIHSIAIDERAVDIFGSFLENGSLTMARTLDELVASVRAPKPIGQNKVWLTPLRERLELVL